VRGLLPPGQPALSLAERVNPRHAAAVFIDLQHDFCSPGGAMDRSGLDPTPMQKVLPGVSLEIMDWGFAEVVPSPRVFTAWEEAAVEARPGG
jgi:nicotinamidase-related amidase